MKKLICIIFILCTILTGCESAYTKGAGLNGMILTDMNGRKWVAKHCMFDAYYLYELKDGKIDFRGY